MYSDINASSALTSIGAIGGIVFSMSRKHGFWATAGFAIIGAVAGAGLGYVYETYLNK